MNRPVNLRSLFEPIELGSLELPNRVLMAPLTRNRAGEGFVPTDMNVEYYRQRASAGLIISEATQVAPEGIGYPNTPGIYSDEQVDGWRRVTEAVHDAGGRIFLQLWHVGRVSHPSMQPFAELPVAPSAIRPEGKAMTYEGEVDFVTPRALGIDEMPEIVEQFRDGALNAKKAGFDGVEVHAANGYLLDQFLRDGSNRRTDAYGGTVENRMRLPLEVLQAVSEVFPKGRTGIRLSPCGTMNGMRDSDPETTFATVVDALNDFDLGYVHVIEAMEGDLRHGAREIPASRFRGLYGGNYLVNGEYDAVRAAEAIFAGEADIVSFGRAFLANPDLPRRFELGAELNEPDPDTFYGGDERGYTDYPTLAERKARDAA